jgi:hypothetical protein
MRHLQVSSLCTRCQRQRHHHANPIFVRCKTKNLKSTVGRLMFNSSLNTLVFDHPRTKRRSPSHVFPAARVSIPLSISRLFSIRICFWWHFISSRLVRSHFTCPFNARLETLPRSDHINLHFRSIPFRIYASSFLFVSRPVSPIYISSLIASATPSKYTF